MRGKINTKLEVMSFEEARDETKMDSFAFSMVSDGSTFRVMVLSVRV